MISIRESSPECQVCGGRSTRRLWRLRFDDHPGPFVLRRCPDCGVAFNWPRLPADAIHDQYDTDYYIFTLPPARRWARAVQLYLEYLHPLEHSPGRRLLDVGCAQGDLLALADRRGWDVHGIELSPEPARRAVAEYGIPVEVGTLEDIGPQLEPFDVVIATDVIEHVTEPQAFVRAMRRVLRPGGQAILETPNFGGFWRKLGGPRWIGLNRFHLFLFTPASLLRLMHDGGFHDCTARTCTHTAYAHWGHRPELARFVRRLPAGLRWRAERTLNQLTPASMETELWMHAPGSLDEALAWIEAAAKGQYPRRRSDTLTGDNLCVTGRA